jgi:hypothetical protein
MARRTLLFTELRTRLFGIPTEASEMAKHYVLGPEDLALIRAKRRSSNRLGIAVQLCLLRYPGQGLGFDEHPPEAMIAFVARQLGVSPSAFSDYALRDQTRREHAVELQKALGLRGFRLADWRACLQVGANAAWATDRGEPIVQAMLAQFAGRVRTRLGRGGVGTEFQITDAVRLVHRFFRGHFTQNESWWPARTFLIPTKNSFHHHSVVTDRATITVHCDCGHARSDQ